MKILRYLIASIIILTIPEIYYSSIALIQLDQIKYYDIKSKVDRSILKKVKEKEYINFNVNFGYVVDINLDKSNIVIENEKKNSKQSYYFGSFIPANKNTVLKVGDSVKYYYLFNLIYYVEVNEKINTNDNPYNAVALNNIIYHKVIKDENLYRISRKYNVNIEDITRLNKIQDINIISEGQIIKIPDNNIQKETKDISNKIYVVKDDDTLSEIAHKLGVSITYLQKLNNIKNIDEIKIGQKLKY